MDLRLKRRVVQSSVPVDGGYRVTFQGCGHTAWFAVDPGRTAYCTACAEELMKAIRQGADVGPVTAGEFLIAHGPRLAEVQQDAQSLQAVVFRRKYGIKPKDYQLHVRTLRDLAARGDPGTEEEANGVMRILLMVWARGGNERP